MKLRLRVGKRRTIVIPKYVAERLGIEEGYRVASTPYGPLICMDRHLTKLMFDRLNCCHLPLSYTSLSSNYFLKKEEAGSKLEGQKR